MVEFSSFTDMMFQDQFGFPKPLCVKIRNLLHRFYEFGLIIRVPQGQVGSSFYTFQLEEIILIYLRRMIVPNQLAVVAGEFGRSIEEISTASVFMAKKINDIAKEYLDGNPWWDEHRARYNAELVNQFDVPLRDVCLFFDTMLQIVSNPWIANTEAWNNSEYCRQAANKFFLAVSPQGLYVFVSGWSEGRRYHGMADAMEHNLYRRLRALTKFEHFNAKIYSDSEFRNEDPLYTPFSPVDTARKHQFNKKMATVSITGEWAFQIVRNLWPSIKDSASQQILESPHANLPGKNLYNSFFLANLFSCFEGSNIIGEYFRATLPSIEDYLGVPENSLD